MGCIYMHDFHISCVKCKLLWTISFMMVCTLQSTRAWFITSIGNAEFLQSNHLKMQDVFNKMRIAFFNRQSLWIWTQFVSSMEFTLYSLPPNDMRYTFHKLPNYMIKLSQQNLECSLSSTTATKPQLGSVSLLETTSSFNVVKNLVPF